MADLPDRRRRRREDVTSESEYSDADTSKASIDGFKKSECESEVDDIRGEGSEYESATEENEEDDYTYTEDYSEDESSVLVEEEYTESDLFEEERQSGDGEEQPSSNQELDDDEDRKNPAFVPRKGMFYEHDDRQGEEEVEGEGGEAEAPPSEEEASVVRKKKQLWQEVHRWDHDRFDESLQAPKSRDELVAAYGYDITAHDKPPEAPPQRGGRGGRNRGRPSENRANFGDYMAGRFDNPRKPRYGPKAELRGRGRGSRGGGGGGGRGPRSNRGGRDRGDYRYSSSPGESGDARYSNSSPSESGGNIRYNKSEDARYNNSSAGENRGDSRFRNKSGDVRYNNSLSPGEREQGQGDGIKSYSDFKRNNYNDDYDKNSSNNRYQNNRGMSRHAGGEGGDGGFQVNSRDRTYHHQNKDWEHHNNSSRVSSPPPNSETRTFTNSRVQGGQSNNQPQHNQHRDYGYNRGSGSGRGSSGRNNVERQERSSNSRYPEYSDARQQYSSQHQHREDEERGGGGGRGGFRNRESNYRGGEGPPMSNNYNRNERRSERVGRKSRSPESNRASGGNTNTAGRAEASLDNLMDIAPPLTTIETRTKSSVQTSMGDIEGRRGGYHGRQRGGRRSQDDGSIKGREAPVKPPRFREQGKDQQPRSGYQGGAPPPQSPTSPTSTSLPPHRAAPIATHTNLGHKQQQPPSTTTDVYKAHQQVSSTSTTTVSTASTVGAPSQAPTKTDVRQTKRYSAQRQRNVADNTAENPTPPPPPPLQHPGMGMVPMVTQQTPGFSVAGGVVTNKPPQVGVLPSGHIVQMAASVGGKPEGPRLVSSPPGVGPCTTSSPVRPRVSPQYFIQQQPQQTGPQQAVFRQPPSVYRPVPAPLVSTPQSPPLSATQQAQLQQHLMQQQQQQAIVMQVPSTQIQAGRIYATSQQVARPPPTAITLATSVPTGQQVRQVMAQRTQFIPATAASLVNLPATRPPGQFRLTGPVPLQFPVPPPPPQRVEVPSTTANVASVVQGQIVTLPPVPQGQLPATAVAIPAGQHPPMAPNQVPAQVVGPPGPGQAPAIHVRGGTTYFHPQIQMFGDARSPGRRLKEPIPIVKPQFPPGANLEGDDARFYETSEGILYQQQYAAYAQAQAQMYGLQVADLQQQDLQQQQPQQQQESKTSSFESILKQSGSLDNIKEFHPQGVSSESLGTAGLVGAETELIGGNSEDKERDGEEGDVLIGDKSELARAVNKDLEQLHISGSSSPVVEHERSEGGNYYYHQQQQEQLQEQHDENQSYSSEGNQSYSSLGEEKEVEEGGFETRDNHIITEEISEEMHVDVVYAATTTATANTESSEAKYNTSTRTEEINKESHDVVHVSAATANTDSSDGRYTSTTEESDSEQFYEAENDLVPEQQFSEEEEEEAYTTNSAAVGSTDDDVEQARVEEDEGGLLEDLKGSEIEQGDENVCGRDHANLGALSEEKVYHEKDGYFVGVAEDGGETLPEDLNTVLSDPVTVSNDLLTIQNDRVTVPSDLIAVSNDPVTAPNDLAPAPSDLVTVPSDLTTLVTVSDVSNTGEDESTEGTGDVNNTENTLDNEGESIEKTVKSESIEKTIESESIEKTVKSETIEEELHVESVVKGNLDINAFADSKQIEGEKTETLSAKLDVL